MKGDRRNRRIIEVLKETMQGDEEADRDTQEKSFIPRGIEEVDVTPELEEIKKGVSKVKAGVKKIKKLEKEKKKIKREIRGQ